jgi:phytoene dehydrogenase-like protein
VRGTPLGKLLRQLRIEREEFALCEQRQSRIAFGPRGEVELRMTNDFAVLEADIADRFPGEIDGFRRLTERVRAFDDVALDAAPLSARQVVREFIRDPLLEDMLFCPLMYYGSAQERDMEFGQFAIMFKALFLEGFARPAEGVRVILRVLLDRLRKAGAERRMKCGVRRILTEGRRARAVVLDSGEEIEAGHILSSIGLEETRRLHAAAEAGAGQEGAAGAAPPSRRLSFAETISILDREPADLGWGDDTIVFFNDSPRFVYERPEEAVDLRSGVICLPNNFRYPAGVGLPEGILRVTALARPDVWSGLAEEEYRENKRRWFDRIQESALRFLPPEAGVTLGAATIATDMFTPRTVERFTGHLEGSIYGSPVKVRSGVTELENVYLCGTDQGFLGIIGAMLSGISMANYHILAKGA